MSQTLELHRLEPFGVEVRGVDLRTVDDGQRSELAALLRQSHLLLFRGQELAAEDQVTLLRSFGTVLDEHHNGTHHTFVSNTREDAAVKWSSRLPFHSDLGFTPSPYLGISLYALEIDDDMPTVYANALAACRDLPSELRAAVAAQKVVNAFGLDREAYHDDHRLRIQDLPAGTDMALYPHDEFPVIDRHPITGDEFLRYSEMQTSYVAGVSERESEALIARLYEHLYRPDHVYEHHWEVGDLVLWDNVALQHGRPEFPGSAHRTLRRVVLGSQTMLDIYN